LIRSYVLTPSADRDADGHFLYIAKGSREAAARFFQSLEASLQKLATMPELGEQQRFERKELADLRVWQVQGFENYLIFYRPVEHGIEVIRILHAARDIAAIFDDPKYCR
jgi:toxin ParE1/3/4